MNREIVEIIKRSEQIKLVEKRYKDCKFYHLRGPYGKQYLLCAEENGDLEKTLSLIEAICIDDNELKEIRPQFIYAVVIKEVNQIDEQTYKDIISIEENEYFCKKYVLYYEQGELEALQKWIDREQTSCINSLLNSSNCVSYMDGQESGEEKQAVNLLLRMIIKCPFIKYRFEKGELLGFSDELDSRLKGIRKQGIDKEVMWKYKEDIFDKLEADNIEEMMDSFIQKVRKEIK